MEINVVRENGKYIIDLGDEGNRILTERYESFVAEINDKRKDLKPEDRAKIIGNEEEQNCRLVGSWMRRFFDVIGAEKSVDKANDEALNDKKEAKDENPIKPVQEIIVLNDLLPKNEDNNTVDEEPIYVD